MITIKQQKENWRLELTNEEWKFNSESDMMDILKRIIDLKNKYGRFIHN